MPDGSEDLRRLAADLSAAPERALGAIDRVVEKGALKIKNDWRASVGGSEHFKHLQFALGYDRVRTVDSVGAEIGYDKTRVQGPLGNIREFGGASVAGHLDGQLALDAEEPRFLAALADAAEQAVLP
jgi:hypothetical protein